LNCRNWVNMSSAACRAGCTKRAHSRDRLRIRPGQFRVLCAASYSASLTS
jgi:hypothetical protein